MKKKSFRNTKPVSKINLKNFIIVLFLTVQYFLRNSIFCYIDLKHLSYANDVSKDVPCLRDIRLACMSFVIYLFVCYVRCATLSLNFRTFSFYQILFQGLAWNLYRIPSSLEFSRGSLQNSSRKFRVYPRICSGITTEISSE